MRRRSMQVSLVLLGVVALSGCGEDQKRHVYRNRQDCVDDWGDEKKCEQPPSGSSHWQSGYWYGPSYTGYAGTRGGRAISAMTVSRGGFGRLGGFHGFGG